MLLISFITLNPNLQGCTLFSKHNTCQKWQDYIWSSTSTLDQIKHSGWDQSVITVFFFSFPPVLPLSQFRTLSLCFCLWVVFRLPLRGKLVLGIPTMWQYLALCSRDEGLEYCDDSLTVVTVTGQFLLSCIASFHCRVDWGQ